MGDKKVTERTYILELRDGGFRKITIPANWKLSYGSIAPFMEKGRQFNGQMAFALRLYEGSKENLRGVMPDVVSFRDISVRVIERKPVDPKSKTAGPSLSEWTDPDAGIIVPQAQALLDEYLKDKEEI